MANYLINGSTMTGIANAIRSKTGQAGSIRGDQMAAAISGISAGYTTKIDGTAVGEDLDLISTSYDSFIDTADINAQQPAETYVSCLFQPIYRISGYSASSDNVYVAEKTISFETTNNNSSHPLFFKTECIKSESSDNSLYYALMNNNVVMFLNSNDDPKIVYPVYGSQNVLRVRSITTLQYEEELTFSDPYLSGFIKGIYPIRDSYDIVRKIYIVSVPASGTYTELGCYDLINKTYTYLARLTSLRVGLGSIPGVVYHNVINNVDHDDLYIIGQYANSDGTSNFQVYKYDSVANSWSQVCNVPYSSRGPETCRDFYIPACVNHPAGDLDSGVHPVARVLTYSYQYTMRLDSDSIITTLTRTSISSSGLNNYIGSVDSDNLNFDYFIDSDNIIRSTDEPYSAPKNLTGSNIVKVPVYTLDEP